MTNMLESPDTPAVEFLIHATAPLTADGIPPLCLTPRSLLLRWHPLRNAAPRQRRPTKPLAELDPEGGPPRHEKRPGPKA